MDRLILGRLYLGKLYLDKLCLGRLYLQASLCAGGCSCAAGPPHGVSCTAKMWVYPAGMIFVL